MSLDKILKLKQKIKLDDTFISCQKNNGVCWHNYMFVVCYPNYLAGRHNLYIKAWINEAVGWEENIAIAKKNGLNPLPLLCVCVIVIFAFITFNNSIIVQQNPFYKDIWPKLLINAWKWLKNLTKMLILNISYKNSYI